MKAHEAAKAMVKNVLLNFDQYKWTIQGFGMLRTYLPDDMRLNVWSESHKVPGVSLVHDHPWDFESYIVAGVMVNRRFTEGPGFLGANLHLMEYKQIRPGEGLLDMSETHRISLYESHVEQYREGTTYQQKADEIHASFPHDGTVTLNKRQRAGRPDVARVFWELGNIWVSGEPRPAQIMEVAQACQNSLNRWFR